MLYNYTHTYKDSVCSKVIVHLSLRSFRNTMKVGNVGYIGWMEEIIGVDYGKFEILLLYCTWVQAITNGPRATIK